MALIAPGRRPVSTASILVEYEKPGGVSLWNISGGFMVVFYGKMVEYMGYMGYLEVYGISGIEISGIYSIYGYFLVN